MNINRLKKVFPIIIIEEESVFKILLRYIEHHKDHYLNLNLFGTKFHPCARCFGYWLGLFIGFFLLSPFWLGFFYTDNFTLVFALSWFLAAPTITDWGTVKLGLRKGNNNIRAIAGFLHGLAVIIYFFILPAGIFFKIATYASYGFVFFFIRKKYHSTHHNLCLTKT